MFSCKSTDRDIESSNLNSVYETEVLNDNDISHGGFHLKWYRSNIDSADSSQLSFDANRKKTLIIIPGHRLSKYPNDDKVSTLKPTYFAGNKVDLRFHGVLGKASSEDIGLKIQCPLNGKSRRNLKADLSQLISKNGLQVCDVGSGYNVAILHWDRVFPGSLANIENILWNLSDPEFLNDDTLVSLYEKLLSQAKLNDEMVVVGHSTGASLALRLYTAVLEAIKNRRLKVYKRVHRLVLADPFFVSRDKKDKNGFFAESGKFFPKSISEMWQNKAEEIRFDQRIEFSPNAAIDIYSTTLDQTETIGDEAKELKFGNTSLIYAELYPEAITGPYVRKFYDEAFQKTATASEATQKLKHLKLTKLQRLHSYPLFWVLDTFSSRGFTSKKMKPVLPSGATDHSTIFDLQRLTPNAYYKQIRGRRSLKTSDDVLKFSLN